MAAVTLTSNLVPGSTIDAFLSYKNVFISTLGSVKRFSFVPLVTTSGDDDDNSAFIRAPRLATRDLDRLHYGLSLFFRSSDITSSGYTYPHKVMIKISTCL